MSCAKDDIRLLCFHILCIHCEEFLVCICVNVFAACQCHQTSHIGILCCNDIAARKSHQDQHLGMVFSLVLLFVFFVEIPELFYQRACLLFSVKDLSQLLDGTVHSLYAPKIQESPVHTDVFVLGFKV